MLLTSVLERKVSFRAFEDRVEDNVRHQFLYGVLNKMQLEPDMFMVGRCASSGPLLTYCAEDRIFR